jgi:hypothetical protein
MTLTTPRRLPKNHPKGDFRARCGVCGAMYYRSQLVNKENGSLACKATCAQGRDEVQLSRMNAERAAQVKYPERHFDPGGTDTNNLPNIHRTTAADILRYRDEDI